jgi:hypothetical protein
MPPGQNVLFHNTPLYSLEEDRHDLLDEIGALTHKRVVNRTRKR